MPPHAFTVGTSAAESHPESVDSAILFNVARCMRRCEGAAHGDDAECERNCAADSRSTSSARCWIDTKKCPHDVAPRIVIGTQIPYMCATNDSRVLYTCTNLRSTINSTNIQIDSARGSVNICRGTQLNNHVKLMMDQCAHGGFKPPHRSRVWMCGFWSALISTMSWTLPAGICFGGSTPAFAEPQPSLASMTQDEEAQFAAEFAVWINATITSSDYDAAPSVHSQFDLTSDGVLDHILVDPGNFFAADGRIMVVDGATNQSLYELVSPHNELCFGEYVGTWPDCNFDGVRELVVASGVQLDEHVEGAIRVFSGVDGQLLGIVKQGHDEGVVGGEVVVAGDRSRDSRVDAVDVSMTVEVLGESSAVCPVDLDIDGETTLIDVLMVAARAQTESQDPTLAASICANICHVNATGDGFVALTGSTGSSLGWAARWTCWVDGAALAAEAAALILAATLCGVSGMAPPAAVACILGWCCGFANFLARLMTFSSTCSGQNPLSPEALAVLHTFELMTALCGALVGGPTLSVSALQSLVREILRFMRST